MSRQEILADLLLVFPLSDLKHDQKGFIPIPSLNVPKTFRHFLVKFIKRLPWKR